MPTARRKQRDTAAMFGLGAFVVIWIAFVMTVAVLPMAFTIFALIDVSRAPDAAFGPPWDNGKSAWLLGLALAFVVPCGTVVGPVLWFTQGRKPLREGRPVPRPFWSRPSVPYPYQGQPPAPWHGQPPQQ
jgi:hypothetical protein